jgi:hypothetical protein
MSAERLVPVLLFGVLVLAALGPKLLGSKNQTLDGVVVRNLMTYEFYPNARDCNYRGTPYVVLPNQRFWEIMNTEITGVKEVDVEHLFRGTWRAKINGNLSRIGRYKYRKTYWREFSVNYVLDAVSISCHEAR